jgi:uncharacterized membrane protein YkvA (DUF1232 family)
MGWGDFFRAVRRREHKLAPMTWVTAIGALVYTFSPFDFVPEILLGPLGLLDDAGIWGIAIALAVREKNRWEAQISGSDAAPRAKNSKGDDSDIIDVESY